MKELINIFERIYSSEEENQLINAKPVIERMYFNYIKKPYKWLGLSEDYRIAKDLVNLNVALLRKREIKSVKIKSDYIQNHNRIKEFKKNDALEDYNIDAIKEEVINSNHHYLLAAFIADIICRENRKETFKWFIAIILSILTITYSIN